MTTKYIVAFEKPEDMTNANILRAIFAQKIERVDVTPEQVRARMSKADAEIGTALEEARWGLVSSPNRIMARIDMVKAAEMVGYFSRYDKVLRQIPVDFNAVRQVLLEQCQIRADHLDSNSPVVGYGHVRNPKWDGCPTE